MLRLKVVLFLVLRVGSVFTLGESCPSRDDIQPCRCTEESNPTVINLHCGNAESLDDVERACQANYGTNSITGVV